MTASICSMPPSLLLANPPVNEFPGRKNVKIFSQPSIRCMYCVNSIPMRLFYPEFKNESSGREVNVNPINDDPQSLVYSKYTAGTCACYSLGNVLHYGRHTRILIPFLEPSQ